MEPYVLSFRPGISLQEPSGGRGVPGLATPHGEIDLPWSTPGVVAAARLLSGPGGPGEALMEAVVEAEGPPAVALWVRCLATWDRLGWIARGIEQDGERVALLVPCRPDFRLPPAPGDGIPHVFSRFAWLRAEGGTLVLESPLSPGRVHLEAEAARSAVGRLSSPATAGDLAAAVPNLAEATAEAVVGLLAASGLITPVIDGRSTEEDDPVLAQWELHDLLFHTRSRMGRHDGPSGGTYPFLHRTPPLPALRPRHEGPVVELHRPDLEALARTDPPFEEVLEGRRSVRQYGERPITARQLGELLYRAARVRRVIPRSEAKGQLYESSDRPYPNGGASYELEIYLTVRECEGLAPGRYWYDPGEHRLHRIAELDGHGQALLRDAWQSAAGFCVPQVLVTLTARFQRVTWKYRGMAYATILKNVGVLYQTLYLVATAMGLAPCGLGNGNAQLMADALGTDFLEESSVGELMLGSRP